MIPLWVAGINLLIIAILLILLTMFWPPDSPWAPWWRTSKKIARRACEIAKVSEKDVVYELGSGDANFLLIAAKEFKAQGVGVEIDPLRCLISKMLVKLKREQGKIKITRKNFYSVDVSKATVIFVYLVPRVLKKLKPKFLKELRSGTKIISYKYKINLPNYHQDKKNKLFFYRIP